MREIRNLCIFDDTIIFILALHTIISSLLVLFKSKSRGVSVAQEEEQLEVGDLTSGFPRPHVKVSVS